MLIDIFHDTACPWCRIGHKHLFDALAQWQGKAVNIHWHPYLLDDTIPAQGVEFRTFMKSRKGMGPQELDQLFDYARQVGEAAGVKLDFAKISLAVNTTLSHRLIALVPESSRNAVVEAVYKAYFEDGLNIGNIDTLVSLGESVGLDPANLRNQLSRDKALDQVMDEASLARQSGVTSIPVFLIDNKVRVEGAYSVQVFRQALNRAALLSVLNPPYWF